jgi:hypothetical protein
MASQSPLQEDLPNQVKSHHWVFVMSVHFPVSEGLLAQDGLKLSLKALKVLDLEPEGS